jgi:hypothetical protein
MKNLRRPALCLCALLFTVCSFAQNENNNHINEPDNKKPKLFSNLPDKISVPIEKITALLSSSVGDAASLRMDAASTVAFDGQVISKASKYDSRIQSTVIRSSNFNGATLTISKVVKEDGTVNYTGRIISFLHGDLFVLEKQGQAYFLVKKNFYDLVNE